MFYSKDDATAGNAIKKALDECRQKLKKLRVSSAHSNISNKRVSPEAETKSATPEQEKGKF